MIEENKSSGDEGPKDTDGTTARNAFDVPTGYSGQGYLREREEAEGASQPSGHPPGGGIVRPASDINDEGSAISERGRRGWIDPHSGEVHGSGSGAGGGNSTEDIDHDTSGGAH